MMHRNGLLRRVNGTDYRSRNCLRAHSGDVDSAREGVQTALDTGIEPGNILADGMIAAMKEVGRLFEDGDYFLPAMSVGPAPSRPGCPC